MVYEVRQRQKNAEDDGNKVPLFICTFTLSNKIRKYTAEAGSYTINLYIYHLACLTAVWFSTLYVNVVTSNMTFARIVKKVMIIHDIPKGILCFFDFILQKNPT